MSGKNNESSNLHTAKKIILIRCNSGWVVGDDMYSSSIDRFFAFESTDSMAKSLKRLIGENKWVAIPERDSRGHFVKQPTQPS